MMRDLTIWKQATQVRRSIFTVPTEDYTSTRTARKAIKEFQPVVDAVLRTAGAVVAS